MEALVKQEIGTGLEVAPGGERPRRQAVQFGLLGVVHVSAGAPDASLGIVAEGRLEFLEQIGRRPEVAVVVVALRRCFLHLLAHFQAVPAMEGVALDEDGIDLLAAENLVERVPDRCRARP